MSSTNLPPTLHLFGAQVGYKAHPLLSLDITKKLVTVQVVESEFKHQASWLGLLCAKLLPNCFLPCQGLITYGTAKTSIRIGINYVLATKCHLQKRLENLA